MMRRSTHVVGILLMLLAAAMLVVGLSCYNTTRPPEPCANIMTCEDPTRPPPAVQLPKDPMAPPFTTFYQTKDGGTDR